MRNIHFPDKSIDSAVFSLRADLKIGLERLNNKTDNIISLNKMKKELKRWVFLKNIFKKKYVMVNN